jgi:general secretion pathway protein D
MNYTKLPKKALLLLATPVFLSLAIPATRLVAQSQTETKIRLMAEALRARDNGDLPTAKVNLEQLLVLAPNDVTVQRLLAGVNDNLAAGSAAPTVAAGTVEPEVIKDVVYNPDAPSTRTAVVEPKAALVVEGAEKSENPPDGIPAADLIVAPVDADSAQLAKSEEARVKQLLVDVKEQRKEAALLAAGGNFDGASEKLESSARSLPVNTLTEGTLDEIAKQKNDLLLEKSQVMLKQGDTKGAKDALDAYIAATSPDTKAAKKQSTRIDEAELNPPSLPIEKLSPGFIQDKKDLAQLTAKGRAQYAAGAYDEAQETFRRVETISSDDPEAKYFLRRIADDKARLGNLNRVKTRSQMIEEVAKSWQRPGVFMERSSEIVDPEVTVDATVLQKLNTIIIPSVSFNGLELGRVISTLSSISEEYDTTPGKTKGVNLVLNNPLAGVVVPQVNITLRNLSLKRVLDIITQSVGYQYDIEADLVLVRPSGTDVNLSTEEFAVTKSAVTRMTGVGAASPSATQAASADPFAPAASAGGGGGISGGGEADAIKRFLAAAGVPFESVVGSSLAYDGSRILVTHTSRNIERIRNILARYNDIRQVEIEAKFIDVSEGTLEELGVSWNVLGRGSPIFNTTSGDPIIGTDGKQLTGNYRTDVGTVNRSLAGAFTASSSSSEGGITTNGVTIPINNSPPSPPGTVNLGGSAAALATVSGVVGEFDVSATLRALSQRSGSDLLSAPKVTVLSGNRANIVVAQEFRYPQSYGEIQSEVGTASGSTTGGGAGVTITAGTPQDFSSRNVGVELAVTPTVEEDDYSISLELNPRVTEFEGFVEYGGTSIAISGSTTVSVPSGFFQPIFSTREINTRVTVWDGATLVMGGLTREEVRRVNDKVPILGDIPYIGRAFRSKGESSQKRNLLIFVTANLVSPGGSLKKQDLRGVPSSSTFQNPTMVTPGGPESRTRGN